MRLEGNDVGDCGVGLSWSDETCAEEPLFARLGFSVERSASVGVPLVADNAFRGCRVADVRNETDTPLLVGDNRWSSDTARVEGNVRVPDFGWTVAIGLGTSTTAPDLILGRLLQWMLLEEGVRVVDLVGLGSEDEIARAFDRGDLDVAWCSETTAAAPGDAFWPTSLARGWLLVVTTEAAEKQTSVDVATPNEVPRDLVVASLERAGLTARSMRSVVTSAEAENLLKFGTVECAVIDRLDETVTLAGFVALDDAGILPSQTLGLRVGKLEESAAVSLRVAFDRLRGHLSDETLRNLASRVRLLGRDPVDVAMEYLVREGLIEGFAEGGPG
jgi:hypothetical protein